MFLKRLAAIPYYFTVPVIVCISTFFVWLPFLLRTESWFGLSLPRSNMLYVYSNFDGPLYIIPAKTLYDPTQISVPGTGLIVSLPLTEKYFAAHLPLYPLLIRAGATVVGYLQSMLFVNLIATIGLGVFFYYIVRKLRLSAHPLALTTVFLLLPRFLVVRSVGAPESLFMLLILLSLYFFEKQKYVASGIFGALATATKILGILLFAAYCVALLEKYLRKKEFSSISIMGICLIPVGLLAVFYLYFIQYHDFWAFFHTGGVVPMVFPYSVFNFQKVWVDTGWLEEVIFYFFMYALMVYQLRNIKERSFYYFGLIFFAVITLVQHRDISRYTLPLWPLAAITFQEFFTSKKFLIALLIVLPAVYLYAWNFVAYNVMPIGDWKPFM